MEKRVWGSNNWTWFKSFNQVVLCLEKPVKVLSQARQEMVLKGFIVEVEAKKNP